MSDFSVHVYGVPCTKGSPMAFLMNKREIAANPKARPKVNMIEGRRGDSKQRYVDWTKAIYNAALLAVQERDHEAFDEPLICSMVFWLPRPKSRKKDVYCDTRPDYSKLWRCVEDELERAGVFTNDARIVKIGEPNAKYYETADRPPGVMITLRPVFAE